VSPASQPFDLTSAGAERSVAFEIQPGASVTAGEHVLRATAEVGGHIYDEGFTLIDYEHIERSAMFADAAAGVTMVPVSVREGLRAGYIMGTGDDGPTALRQMGASVALLSEADVRDGAFSDYDVIVLGVRAYETRPDVRAANGQLLDFVRSGGTVVNQYNQYRFSNGGYAPYDLTIGRPAPRVADEGAAITMLEPGAPVFTTPNRITQADFDGWVQERGLYFASEWGDEYVPLLELKTIRMSRHDTDRCWSRRSERVCTCTLGCHSSGSGRVGCPVRTDSSPTWSRSMRAIGRHSPPAAEIEDEAPTRQPAEIFALRFRPASESTENRAHDQHDHGAHYVVP